MVGVALPWKKGTTDILEVCLFNCLFVCLLFFSGRRSIQHA